MQEHNIEPKPNQAGLFDQLSENDEVNGVGIRSLRADQYDQNAMADGQQLRTVAEISHAIGDALTATGSHSESIMGLYSFVRQGRGAGFQAVTRDPHLRPSIVVRNFEKSTGEVLAAVEFQRLDEDCLFDFQNLEVQQAFLKRYPRFNKQLNQLAHEGVVAIRHNIPNNAVTGLMRIVKPADATTLHLALQALLGDE